MSSERKDRDARAGLEGVLADDESWDEALDQWDKSFPAEQPATPSVALERAQAPAVGGPKPEEQDALVEFIVGDMDLPEEGGEALGSLLGSTPVAEEPTPVRAAPAGSAAATTELLGPVQLAAEEEPEIEIAPTVPRAVRPSLPEPAPPVHEEPTPVRRPPPATALPAAEEPSAEIDIGALLDSIGTGSLQAAAPPAAPAAAPARPASALVEPAAPPAPAAAAAIDIFDEILPRVPEPEDAIEAGEVLPQVFQALRDGFGLPAPPAARGPESAVAQPQPAIAAPVPEDEAAHTLPVSLGDDEIEEPPPPTPPIPERLRELALDGWQLPAQGEAVSLPRVYWERLSERLQLEANLTDSGMQAAALELMTARAFEETGEIDEAIVHYREVLNHRPGNLPALRELRRQFAARGELDQVAELMGQMEERVGPDERRALALARAELLWSRSGDDGGARALLDGIADRSSRDLRTLLIRVDLATASGDDDELADRLTALAEAITDPTAQSALHVEVGRLRESAGQAEAASAAYRRAADADATCAPAHESLIRLAANAQDGCALSAALARSAISAGRWGARRLRRRARLLQHAPERRAALEEAASLAADDVLVLEDLARARAEAGDAAGAIEIEIRLAGLARDPLAKAQALQAAARLAEDGLHDRARARGLLDQARQGSPELVSPREAVSSLQLRDPAAESRAEALRAAAAAAKGSQRAALHFAAAQVQELELKRPADAAVELVACLEHEPSFRPALARLERIYRKEGQLERLAAALDTAAEAAEHPLESGDFRERAALLYEGRLAQPEHALRRYRRIRESQPEAMFAQLGVVRNLEALAYHDDLSDELAGEAATLPDGPRAARVWARCGAALAAAGRKQEAEASLRMAADKLPDQPSAVWPLVIRLAQQGRWGEVAERWASLAGAFGDTPQRKAYLMRLAALHERVTGDRAEAASSYHAAAVPPHAAPGAGEGRSRIARALQSWDALQRDLARELGAATEPATRCAALLALADLGRRAGAPAAEIEEHLRRALEEVPRAPIVRLALEHHHVARQAWQPLADLHLADLSEATGADRVRGYRALWDLDLRRGDESSARLSCESIVEIDPRDLPSLRFLERFFGGLGRTLELAGALRREAEASSPRDSAALWLELARLLAGRPAASAATSDDRGGLLAAAGEGTTAAAALQALLARDPGCLLALRQLVDAAWASGDRVELARDYVLLARAVGRKRDAAIYLARAGELVPDAEALGLYREALDLEADYLGAIYRLRDLALRMGDWQQATTAAEAEGRASRVRSHAGEAYLLAGELALHKLGDAARAVQAYRCVLEADPSNRIAFDALRAQCEERREWAALADLLEARTRVERSRAKLTELRRSLSDVAASRLGDRERAKRELRHLLKLRADDVVALATLAEMCSQDQEWAEAASSLMQLVRLEKSPVQLRDLFLRLGRIYHDKLPDARRAIASLGKVVTLEPGHLEALSRLSDLYLANWEYKRALAVTTQLYERESDPAKRVEHVLRIAKIHEDGLKDPHRAAISYRQALEQAPTDLKAIGELCGFFARQGDQRSLMVHLDRSVAAMRARIKQDPFDAFSYHALFKIFGWRKAPDACLCAGQVLEAIDEPGPEQREFIETHVAGVGAPGSALGDPEHDEWLFVRSIPGGFRQVFQLLADAFARDFPGDLRAHGASRSDRISNIDHPLRQVGDSLARDLGIAAYEVCAVRSNPSLLVVENTSPPTIAIGSALLEAATEEELRFIMGRSLWMIRKAMILPCRLKPADLEILVASVVRQYAPEFQPADVNLKELQDATRRVARAIPRKLRQELMPFALECSGTNVDLPGLGAAVVHSANRAGLLAARSFIAALSVLRKMSGRQAPRSVAERVRALRGNPEVEELLSFAVSDAHFELRRAMHIAIR